MFLHIVVIAWLYVAVMMAAAEGLSPQGSVLGAVFTFLLYGALPIGLVVYILATPSRKRARKAREAQEAATDASAASIPPDQRRETPAGRPVAPVREEP